MFKNVASQTIDVFAFDYSTGAPKTGDAANLTVYLSKDDGTLTALTDTSATEISSTNAPGWYRFDVSQSESNADKLLFTGKSSTSNVTVVCGPARYTKQAFPVATARSCAIKKGSASRNVVIRITKYNGDDNTAVAYNTSGLALKYWRSSPTSAAQAVAITLADPGTVEDDWVSGGFTAIGNGNYRLDVPNAAFATGANEVLIYGTLSGNKIEPVLIELVDYDPTDATDLGLSAFSTIATDASSAATNASLASTEASAAVSAAGTAASEAADASAAAIAAQTRVELALPNAAPATDGGLILVKSRPRRLWLSASGSNSNSGLTYDTPVQTVAYLNSIARDNDTVMLSGSVDTVAGFSQTKILNWKGVRASTAKLTCSQPNFTIKFGSGAAGSTMEDMTVEQTYNTLISSVVGIAPIGMESTWDVTLKNVVASIASDSYVSHGVWLSYCRNIKMFDVIARGYARGLSIYDTTLLSERGEYTGGECGTYLDCEITDPDWYDEGRRYTASSWTSVDERFFGIWHGAGIVPGTWAGIQAVLYECHEALARHLIRFVNPRFSAIVTNPSYPNAVSLLFSGAPSYGPGGGQGTPVSGDSINNADIIIEGGGYDKFINEGSGPSYHLLAVEGHRNTTIRATNFNHDTTLNTGDVQVINTDIKDTLSEIEDGTTGLAAIKTAAASAATTASTVNTKIGSPDSTLAEVIDTNLDAKVSEVEGGRGTTVPVNQVAVPLSRTWILKATADGLRGELPLYRNVGENQPFAVDFRNDLPTNGRLLSLDSVTIVSATAEGGIVISTDDNDIGVDRSQAKFKAELVEDGTYVLELEAAYDNGEGVAQVTMVVR